MQYVVATSVLTLLLRGNAGIGSERRSPDLAGTVARFEVYKFVVRQPGATTLPSTLRTAQTVNILRSIY